MVQIQGQVIAKSDRYLIVVSTPRDMLHQISELPVDRYIYKWMYLPYNEFLPTFNWNSLLVNNVHSIFKLMIVNKINAITNLNYLLNSVSNINERMKNPGFHSNKLVKIRDKISNPITQFVTREDIKSIDQVAAEFASRDFCNKVFIRKDLSNKLEQLWNMLDDIYNNDPTSIVECVTHVIEKRIPKTLKDNEKNDFRNKYLMNFIGTSEKINTVTDFIFDQVKSDKETKTLHVLSICGVLLSFVVNSQSHLYFVMASCS